MCPWLVLGILERLGVIEVSTLVAFYQRAVDAMGLIPVWLYMSLIFVCIPGIIAGVLVSRKVTAPITELAQAAKIAWAAFRHAHAQVALSHAVGGGHDSC